MRFLALLSISLITSVAYAQAPSTPPPVVPQATSPAQSSTATPPAASGTTTKTHPHRTPSTTPRQTPADKFTSANTTHDGHLTEAQAKLGMPAVYRHFQAIDADHKGYVTSADIKAYNHSVNVKRAQARKAKAAVAAPPAQ